MKVYVDELPKHCSECKFLGVFGWCNYLKDGVCDEIKNNKRHILCPLKPLADHDKQVRKQVCDEIREKVIDFIERKGYKTGSLCNFEYANGYCYGLQYDLAKILDQIEKGEQLWK